MKELKKLDFMKIVIKDSLDNKEILMKNISDISVFNFEVIDEDYFGYYLDFVDNKWALFSKTQENFSPIVLDFIKELENHKRKRYALSREPLAKALSLKKNKVVKVLDAMCGSGSDFILMSSFGAQVDGVEKNPYFYLLLKDALNRAQLQGIFKNNFMIHDDGIIRILDRPNEFSGYDCLYLDPMYCDEASTKSKPSKVMQILRAIVSQNSSMELLQKVIDAKIFSRIVVKRPLRAKPLISRESISFKGKAVRYDVYL